LGISSSGQGCSIGAGNQFFLTKELLKGHFPTGALLRSNAEAIANNRCLAALPRFAARALEEIEKRFDKSVTVGSKWSCSKPPPGEISGRQLPAQLAAVWSLPLRGRLRRANLHHQRSIVLVFLSTSDHLHVRGTNTRRTPAAASRTEDRTQDIPIRQLPQPTSVMPLGVKLLPTSVVWSPAGRI